VGKLPKKYLIPAVSLLIFSLLYVIIFVREKPVEFSYAGATCVKQFTLFPKIQKTTTDSSYDAQPAKLVTIGNATIAARSMCFMPKQTPKPGSYKAVISPGGGVFARKTFTISVASPPVAQVSALSKPVPISKPIDVSLSSADTIFSYYLSVNDKKVRCIPSQSRTSCDVRKLELRQGMPYDFQLIRQYGNKKVATVISKKIVTLAATKVVESTIKPNEMVYAKPKTMSLVFDKKLTKVTPKVFKVTDGKRTAVSLTSAISDKSLSITFTEELPRSADFELSLEGLEATDGSSLDGVYVSSFKTSGGPRVTGVNVGRSGVAIGATAVITFDQTLSDKQDISKFVGVSGGAVLSGKKDNQVLVSLAGVPKCGDFGIKLANDLQSNYDIGGNSAWEYSGRMICHSVSTVGYSSRGRPINAFIFGDGGNSVLFTGAIHGNEVSTRSLMNRWVDDLEANARSIPAGRSVIVIPQINPDGVASGTRTNGRNVDLNRNFGTSDWQTDITDVNNRPFPGGGGGSPMSEPETQAIGSFVARMRPSLVLSYHSIGGLLAANQYGRSNALAGTYSQLSGYRNTTGQTGSTFEYSISGTADDYYGERLGVASILIELSSHTNAQFNLNQKAMWAMVNS
jgi:hypothetical protein